jgi:hypothetical protein
MACRSGWLGRAGWLLAFTGPVAAVTAMWQRLAGSDRIVAVIVGLAAEIGLAITAFAKNVMAEIVSRWQKRLANYLDTTIIRIFSRFEKRYRVFVLAGLRYIDLKGLTTVGFFTPELDEVFVDVSLALRAPHQVPAGLLADLSADVKERLTLEELLDHAAPVVLAIIGVPGSGKTTLLRYAARQICKARRGRRRPVPILLYLRDHVTAIVANGSMTLPDVLRTTLGDVGKREPPGWFEQRLNEGDCVVMLDGLDEVAHQEDRRKVSSWVERQIQQYSRNDFVITSRPHGYRVASIEGATVLQVRGFTTDQVARFVRGWYLAVERRNTNEDIENFTAPAETGANDLLQRLRSSPGLYDLTVNPLLLTMIANVHRYRGALPGSRVELYDEICQVMLWRRQEAKKLEIQLTGAKKELLLRDLAYTMMDRRLRDLKRKEVLVAIKRTLRRVSKDVTAEDFLADVSSNGLLIERESELYSFAHHTFQEYLAAEHMRQKGVHKILAKTVDDVWWRETALLYTARADGDPIVEACLESGTITALALAFDCADQTSELAPELRDRLDELLGTASAPDTDPERRRLIAGVLLTRHLQQQIRTKEDHSVCAHPITATLYQLFRLDTQIAPPDGPSEHRTSDDVALGMRLVDANGFVAWANGIIANERVCRLPSRTEIDDPAVQRILSIPDIQAPARSIWLASELSRVDLWIPGGTQHPHVVSARTLMDSVEDDLARSRATLTRLLLLWCMATVDIVQNRLSLSHEEKLVGDSDRARALRASHIFDRKLGNHSGLKWVAV